MNEYTVTVKTTDGTEHTFSQVAQSLNFAYETVRDAITKKKAEDDFFAFTGRNWVQAIRARDVAAIMVEG